MGEGVVAKLGYLFFFATFGAYSGYPILGNAYFAYFYGSRINNRESLTLSIIPRTPAPPPPKLQL